MMDYNGYYSAQAGQPPPPQPMMMSSQHDCNMMGGQMMPSNGPTMMHSPAPSTPQSMRHTPGPPPIPQQPQHHQQHMGHPMTPQQQPSPHPNYHQLPSHPPMSHSASPHPSSTPHAQSQPPSRPATGPSPLNHQSPIHMNGPSPKIQAHGHIPPQPQSSNHMPAGIPGGPPHPPMMPATNHLPQHQHHGHNFSGSPMPQHPNPHYGQPQPMNHLSHPNMNHGLPPPPPPMQTGPSLGPPPTGYMPSHPMHIVNQERGSPFYHQHIPQTEFRILELNKRLQNRIQMRGQPSPLPYFGSEEANWWERFVCEFFDDDSTLTIRIPGQDKPREWKIGRALIPRFFRSYFEGGITDLSIKPRVTRETSRSPSFVTLDCEQADIITKHIFKQHGTNFIRSVVVHTEGHLSLDFVSNSFNDQLMIKSWRFYANQCHEYIDRSMTNTALPSEYINQPVTNFGLTNSTLMYLRMCMVMEPMQDLMAHHIQTKIDPKNCLKHILLERYKIKNIEPQPKRRKRKAPAATAAPRATPFSKKAKVNGANALNNNIGMNNNLMPPNDLAGGLSLASQDVLVVGEPSMLGADFGDENERRITRLENNQYDPSLDSNPQTSISNNGNQMNQHPVRINSGQDQHPNQQSDIISMMNPPSNHDASGNNVQDMLGYPMNSNNHMSNTSNDHGNDNSNGLGESNLGLSNNVNNCVAPNDNSTSNEVNHQMNYPMNGETNHIVKAEIDMQAKQNMASTQVADSEVSRD